jgi:hypothetical protein
LKLTNVLIRDIPQVELMDSQRLLHMMHAYILSKNNMPQGPLIQYTNFKVNESGEPIIITKYMIQTVSPLEEESPYEFKSIVKQENCLFARFEEKEENLQFAYQKLGVYAFENDMKLQGNSYTVFVDRKEDGNIVADIFMPIKRGK